MGLRLEAIPTRDLPATIWKKYAVSRLNVIMSGGVYKKTTKRDCFKHPCLPNQMSRVLKSNSFGSLHIRKKMVNLGCWPKTGLSGVKPGFTFHCPSKPRFTHKPEKFPGFGGIGYIYIYTDTVYIIDIYFDYFPSPDSIVNSWSSILSDSWRGVHLCVGGVWLFGQFFSICSLSLNVFPRFRVFPQERWLRVSAQVKVRCRFWICFQTVSFVSQVWWRVLWFRDGVGQSLPFCSFVLWNWFAGAISQRFSVLSKVFPPCCCKLASSCFPLVSLLVSLHWAISPACLRLKLGSVLASPLVSLLVSFLVLPFFLALLLCAVLAFWLACLIIYSHQHETLFYLNQHTHTHILS